MGFVVVRLSLAREEIWQFSLMLTYVCSLSLGVPFTEDLGKSSKKIAMSSFSS